jgi:hypothetical protein
VASSSTPTTSSWPSRYRPEPLIIPISDGEDEEQAATAAAYSNLGGGAWGPVGVAGGEDAAWRGAPSPAGVAQSARGGGGSAGDVNGR